MLTDKTNKEYQNIGKKPNSINLEDLLEYI